MKRITSLTLALLLAIACFTGCGGDVSGTADSAASSTSSAASAASSAAASSTAPADSADIVDMTGIVTTNSDSVFPYPIVNQVCQEAGINMTWQIEPSADWSTKKGVLLASGNLPDVFFGVNLTATEVSNGSFLDWAPYLDQAPNILRFFEEVPDAKNMATSPEGKVYGIPNKIALRPESGDVLYINKTWLDKFSLSVPKTTEEFYTALKTFVDNDANGNGQKDEIGITGVGLTPAGGTDTPLTGAGKLSFVFPAFGVVMNHSNTHVMMIDGEPVFGPTMDGYKEAMKYINRLYSDGLIDSEYFSLDFATQAAKYRGEELTVGAGSGWTMQNNLAQNLDHYVLIDPLVGPNGDQYWNSSAYAYKLYANRAAIAASCKDPERAVKLFNLCYDEYTGFQLTYGSEGIGVEMGADGKPAFLPTPDGYTDPEWKFVNGLDTGAPTWNSDEFIASIGGENDMFGKYNFDVHYSPWFLPESRYPYVSWDKATMDELAILKTDIDSAVDQGFVGFMTEGGVDEGWDAYVETLNRMGLDRLMDIYREGYGKSGS